MKLSVKFAGIFAVLAFALTVVSAEAAFTRDLTLGSTGADVIELQTVLETNGYLTIPAGTSKGYFGGLTQAALAKWQAAVGISPAAGYFGPITRAKLAEMPSTGTPSTPGTGSNDLSGGEASLEQFDISSEDDAEEGQMTHVATIEFDVEDADVQIDRVDLEFLFTGSGDADSDPWDVFETITLMVDGDEVAEEDVEDEDEWLRDDSPFVFRLSQLDLVVEEGETAEIEVYLTTMNNVDGVSTASWTIAVDDDGIRGTDGEGIQQYIGDDSDTVAFSLDEEGGDEDVQIKSSSSDPDATTLLVDENDESEWHEVFIFEIEAEESDIELDELVLLADIGLSTSTLNKVVSDMYIEIDGEEFDDYEIADGTATSSEVTFDIDGDFTIDADEQVEVVVFVEFNKQEANYNDGATTFQLSTESVDGEGVDNVSDDSVATGAEHTLSTSVGAVTSVEWTTSESANGETGILDLFFTVTAEEDDFQVLGADILDTLNGTASSTTGVESDSGFGQLTRISGDSVTTLGGDAGFTVNEGDTVKFRVRYEKRTPGSLEVTVESVAGQELADDDQLSPTIILE